jgi:hypothetical protein
VPPGDGPAPGRDCTATAPSLAVRGEHQRHGVKRGSASAKASTQRPSAVKTPLGRRSRGEPRGRLLEALIAQLGQHHEDVQRILQRDPG